MSKYHKSKDKHLQGLPWWSIWLRFRASTAGVTGLIPGQGTRIPTCCTAWPKRKKKKDKHLYVEATTIPSSLKFYIFSKAGVALKVYVKRVRKGRISHLSL